MTTATAPQLLSPNAQYAARPDINEAVGDLYGTYQTLHGWLKSKGRIKTGVGGTSKIQQYQTAETSQFASAGAFTVLERQLVHNMIQAEYDWGAFTAYTLWDGLERNIVEAAGNGHIRNFIAHNMEKLRRDVFKRFSPLEWDGDGTSVSGGSGVGIVGINQAVPVANTTGTYAGLSRVTYSPWRPQYRAAASTGPTGDPYTDARYVFRQLQNDCTRKNSFGRDTPDGLFCARDAHSFVQDALQASQTDMNVSNAGKTMSVMGLDVMMDDDLATGVCKMLNSDTIVLETPTPTLFQFFEQGNIPNMHPRTAAYTCWIQARLCVLNPRNNGTTDGWTL